MNWLNYIIKRLLLLIPTFLGISIMTFIIINLAPGGPVEQQIQAIRFRQSSSSSAFASGRSAQNVSPQVVEALRKQYGFDKPLWKRYLLWLRKVTTLDFGKSIIFGRPVNEVIRERLPVSMQFGLASFLLTYLISILLSLAMTWKRERLFDTISCIALVALASIPVFVLGVLLLVVFAGRLDLLPAGYLQSDDYSSLALSGKILDRVRHFILPLICYVAGGFTVQTLLSRNLLLEELNKEYIRVARAKGASEFRILARHALRNAIIPVVTGVGGVLGIFLAGSVLVENIFQLQGLGLLGFQGIMSRDYNVIMGLLFWSSLAMLLGNLLGDILNSFIDPRVSYQ
jgi:microcin C transport system permease protein